MPEISSTMYPIIIGGAAAIVVLLLLLVVARRRKVSRDRPADEHGLGDDGAEAESLGVRLIEDGDDVPGGDGDEAGSGRLVTWGPEETGPERAGAAADTDGGSRGEADTATEADPPAENPRAVSGAEPVADTSPPADSAPPPATGTGPPPENESTAPEGQPFERDGRWWFRRDGELLVYDDATSEWKAAPQTGSPLAGTVTPVAAADTDTAAHAEALGGVTTTIEREAPRPDEGALRPRSEGAIVWKCGTCGATNGSAAESCRMCFAAPSR